MSNARITLLAAAALLIACQTATESEPTDGAVAVSANELSTTNILPEADTTLRLAVRYGNDGTGTRLGVSSASIADLERTLIRFPKADMVNAVGPEALHKAELELTVDTFSAGWAGGRVEILPMVFGWPEGNGLAGNGPSWVCSNDTNTTIAGNLADHCTGPSSTPWGMLPTDPRTLAFTPEAIDSVALFTGGPRKIRFDVTADVQRIINGGTNNGWILKGQASTWSGQLVNFRSRETSEPPRLIIESGADQCLGDPNKGVRGVCGCGTPDRDTNGDGVVDCFGAVVSATHDTTVRQIAPNGNDGRGQLLGVTKASLVSLERGLVRVDTANIQTAIAGREVAEAYLELSIAGMSVDWGGQVELRELTKDWVEGTGAVSGGSGPTWMCRHDSNTNNLTTNCTTADRWGMQLWEPNRPFGNTVSARVPLQLFGRGTLRFDVTADVKRYLTGTTNRGWVVMGTEDLLSTAYVNFGSRQSGAPPRLLIKLLTSCPDDPFKSTPGACGCGVPDTDSDHDTVADCIDDCDSDPLKQKPGVCGCGVSDIDGDNDKVPDCEDECPADPTKTRKGDCGCGDDPAAPGKSCNDGICPGCFTCDGAGTCGDPDECIPATGCTYTEFRGRTYWVCGPSNWSDAEETCREAGGSLVVIDDVAEDTFVSKLVTQRSWVGFNDAFERGVWTWYTPSGDPGLAFWEGDTAGAGVRRNTLYVSWGSGEPSAAERCGAIERNGGWFVHTCSDVKPFVCEMTGAEASGVPECLDPVDRCKFRPGLTCPSPPVTVPSSCSSKDPGEILDELATCEAAGCLPSQAACLAANCTGAATPPTGDSCGSLSNEESRNCMLEPLVGACPAGELDHCGSCDSDADCDTAAGYICNIDYPCAHWTCDPDGSNCNEADPDATDCPGMLRCGLPVESCLSSSDVDGLCSEVDPLPTCPIFTATEDDADPTLDPATTFGPDIDPTFDPDFPEEDKPSSPDYDKSCEELNSCPFTGGRAHHDWCFYDVEDTLPQNSEDAADTGNSGRGKLVSFNFSPAMWMDYEASPGPLGLAEFALDAGASFSAGVLFKLPVVDEFEFKLLDLEMSAQANPCTLTTGGSKLKVLGSDLLPELLDFLDSEFDTGVTSDDFPFEIPEDPEPSTSENEAVLQCQDVYADFREAVMRAKKAFKDAQWLVTKYNEAKSRTPAERFDAQALCEEVKANLGPRNFPAVNCTATTVEDVINAFIAYYRDEAMGVVRAKAREFASSVAALRYEQPFGCGSPDCAVRETELIARVPFSVGPIPMLLELEAFMEYGIDGTATVAADLSGIMEAVTSRSDTTAEIAYAGANVEPFAGAGITLFVGVGFDFGPVGASAGVEGQLTLATLSLPIYARAGIKVGTEDSSRPVTPPIAAVQGTDQDLIKSRAYKFQFTYAIGSGIRIENVLRGVINARARIKVLFFSKTWRVTILEFKGFCNYDKDDEHSDDCYFPLVTGGGEFEGKTEPLPWGTVEMPMPFVSMRVLPPGGVPASAPVTPATAVRVPNGKYFYDRDCQCVDAGLDDDVPVEDRCYQDADCCPGTQDRCFLRPEDANKPATEQRRDCIACRDTGDTCYEDSDCCTDKQCFKGPEDSSSNPPVCITTRPLHATCNETNDCGFDATLGCWDDPDSLAPPYKRCKAKRLLDETCRDASDCAPGATLGCWNTPDRTVDICSDKRSCGESCSSAADCLVSGSRCAYSSRARGNVCFSPGTVFSPCPLE